MKKVKTTISPFPYQIISLLAILTIPRAVVHDLKLLPFDSMLYIILAVVPWGVWFLAALLWKTKRPVFHFVILGLAYGLLLALTHQLLWDVSWGNSPPQLHGNLEDKLDPALEAVLLRCAAFISSVLTGLVTGLIFAAVAFLASKIRPIPHSKQNP